MRRFTRRAVVIGGAAAIAAAVLGTGIALGPQQAQLRRAFSALLRRHAPDLSLANADFDRLVSDFALGKPDSALTRNPVAGLAMQLYLNPLNPIRSNPLERAEQGMLRHLLLSTDLFDAVDAGRKQIRFVRSSDPYRAACAPPSA
jgi:hypothetical protein